MLTIVICGRIYAYLAMNFENMHSFTFITLTHPPYRRALTKHNAKKSLIHVLRLSSAIYNLIFFYFLGLGLQKIEGPRFHVSNLRLIY